MKHLVVLTLLGLAVLGNGIAVAYGEYRGRTLLSELQMLRRNSRDLKVQWQQLQLEKSSLDAESVVDHVARDQLGMTVPEPTEIIYVRR